mmetsp:Transcript_36111/g.84355  ORF Transcript_36111/g.84355 Transcript_36111/m.84355 type:complete len:372 (-) Transcript_36111:649-1764(-)
MTVQPDNPIRDTADAPFSVAIAKRVSKRTGREENNESPKKDLASEISVINRGDAEVSKTAEKTTDVLLAESLRKAEASLPESTGTQDKSPEFDESTTGNGDDVTAPPNAADPKRSMSSVSGKEASALSVSQNDMDDVHSALLILAKGRTVANSSGREKRTSDVHSAGPNLHGSASPCNVGGENKTSSTYLTEPKLKDESATNDNASSENNVSVIHSMQRKLKNGSAASENSWKDNKTPDGHPTELDLKDGSATFDNARTKNKACDSYSTKPNLVIGSIAPVGAEPNMVDMITPIDNAYVTTTSSKEKKKKVGESDDSTSGSPDANATPNETVVVGNVTNLPADRCSDEKSLKGIDSKKRKINGQKKEVQKK